MVKFRRVYLFLSQWQQVRGHQIFKGALLWYTMPFVWISFVAMLFCLHFDNFSNVSIVGYHLIMYMSLKRNIIHCLPLRCEVQRTIGGGSDAAKEYVMEILNGYHKPMTRIRSVSISTPLTDPFSQNKVVCHIRRIVIYELQSGWYICIHRNQCFTHL